MSDLFQQDLEYFSSFFIHSPSFSSFSYMKEIFAIFAVLILIKKGSRRITYTISGNKSTLGKPTRN